MELIWAINDNLAAQTMALFTSWFEDNGIFSENPDELSDGWEVTTLGEKLTTTTTSVNPQKMSKERVWHYSIPAFDSQRLPSYDVAKGILSNKYLVPANAILVSKLNPETKRVWRTLDFFEDAICSTEFIVFQPNCRDHRAFYYLLFNTKAFIDFLVSNATGSTNSRMRVKPTSSLDFQFACPPNEIIERFCSIVEPMLSQIDMNLLEIRNLTGFVPIAVARMMSSSR